MSDNHYDTASSDIDIETSSDIDIENRCNICFERLTEKKSIVMKCCNYVIHPHCFQEYNRTQKQWNCVNPYCHKDISNPIVHDNPDVCPLCFVTLDTQAITMFTGCCHQTVHTACYLNHRFTNCPLCSQSII